MLLDRSDSEKLNEEEGLEYIMILIVVRPEQGSHQYMYRYVSLACTGESRFSQLAVYFSSCRVGERQRDLVGMFSPRTKAKPNLSALIFSRPRLVEKDSLYQHLRPLNEPFFEDPFRGSYRTVQHRPRPRFEALAEIYMIRFVSVQF